MTLKELYEYYYMKKISAQDLIDVIGDYLSKPAEYRGKYSFEDYLEELAICPRCGETNERDNMTYHVWDVGDIEELICESCRNDESW